MKRHKYTKNQIFREFECKLSVEETAELCFKHIKTVKEWDKGREIPPCCKRLMRLHSGRELSHLNKWDEFRMVAGRLELPNGQFITPQEILLGTALVYSQSEDVFKTSTHLIKLARAVAKLLVLERR